MSVPFSLGEPPVPKKPPLPLEPPLYPEATKNSSPTLLNLHLYKIPISNQDNFLFNVYILKLI